MSEPPKKSKAGRKSKFNEDRVRDAINALRAGCHMETAAGIAGIDQSSFFRWLRMGRDPKGPKRFRQFYQSVERAKHEAILRNVVKLQELAQAGDSKAIMWFLTRRAPHLWGDGAPPEPDLSMDVSADPAGGRPVIEIVYHPQSEDLGRAKQPPDTAGADKTEPPANGNPTGHPS